MEPAAHLDALERASRTLLDTARGALDRTVPACPGWDVADLVVHVGLVWKWAADTVEQGKRAERGEPPDDRDEATLLAWARGGADRLVTALGAADPDADCWTFGQPRSARFWFRRQALETALHAWDAGAATGTARLPEATLAADGIDEFLTVMVPRHVRHDPGDWNGESLHLHRTDSVGEWLVRLGAAGSVGVSRSHGKGDVALRGTAADLWLWTTNRVALDELEIEVFGDRAISARWTAQIAF